MKQHCVQSLMPFLFMYDLYYGDARQIYGCELHTISNKQAMNNNLLIQLNPHK